MNMKRIVALLFLSVLSIFLHAKTFEQTTIGFIGEDISALNYSEAKIAIRMWAKKVADASDKQVHIKFYKTYNDFENSMQNDNVDSIILTSFSYLKYKEKIKENFDYGWLKLYDNDSFFTRYLFIGHTQTQYDNDNILKVFYFLDDNIAKMILNKMAQGEQKKFKLTAVKKESKALLNIFFKKDAYCLISEPVWKMAVELNPQIKKDLKIIHKTDKIFFTLISLMSKHTSKKTQEDYIQAINDLDTTEFGKQLMNLFKFNGIKVITVNELAPLEEYYSSYIKMQKETK